MQTKSETFLEAVKLLKERTGLKNYQIAAKLGVRKTYFSELVNGREPGSKLLLQLDSLVKLSERKETARPAGISKQVKIQNNFCESLRRIRGGRSQAEMADLLGIESELSYAAYENGTAEPGISLICDWAEKLGVSVKEILGLNAKMTRQDAVMALRHVLMEHKEKFVIPTEKERFDSQIERPKTGIEPRTEQALETLGSIIGSIIDDAVKSLPATPQNEAARPASTDSPQPEFVAPPSRRSAEGARRNTSSRPRSKGQSREGDDS